MSDLSSDVCPSCLIPLVSISCVDFDSHAVVDHAIKGFFVDADGKKGLSGKVVTRAGATLARSFIAGTIAGISQSVEGSFGSLSTSALGSVRSLDAGGAVRWPRPAGPTCNMSRA